MNKNKATDEGEHNWRKSNYCNCCGLSWDNFVGSGETCIKIKPKRTIGQQLESLEKEVKQLRGVIKKMGDRLRRQK